MTRTEQINRVKLLLGLTEIKEDLTNLYFDIIEQRVKNYCHRDDVPPGLELIIVQMVVDYYRRTVIATEGSEADAKSVKAITRGDTRIEYGLSEDSTAAGFLGGIDEFIIEYYYQLNNYRKLVSL